MKLIPEPCPNLAIRSSGGAFTVKLGSGGNPDHGQDPDAPLYGVPDCLAHVDTLIEARDICRAYIRYFDLGGGNWVGGEVARTTDGLVIGRFSYNGRLWKTGAEEITIA